MTNGSTTATGVSNGKTETPEEEKLRLKRERLEAWKAKKAAEAAKGGYSRKFLCIRGGAVAVYRQHLSQDINDCTLAVGFSSPHSYSTSSRGSGGGSSIIDNSLIRIGETFNVNVNFSCSSAWVAHWELLTEPA